MQTALLIFIAIFALAIGFFLGLFLLSIDAPFMKKLFQKEEVPAEDHDSKQEAQQAELPGLKKPSPASQLLLQVWKEEGKEPVYEFNGMYVAKDSLPEELLNVVTVQKPPVPAPQTPPPQKPAPPVSEPEPVGEEPEEGENEVKMLSVVDEVNEILQNKLHGSPMAGKGIHLMENHNREIRFWVGLQSYNDVSEIPDPEIQRLINESVKEWEQSRE